MEEHEANTEAKSEPSDVYLQRLDGYLQRLDGFEQQLTELRVQQAARTPVEEVVKYLLYFWTALAVVVALFGIKQFADLGAIVSEQITKQLPREEQEFARFRELVKESMTLTEELNELTLEYEKKLAQLEKAGVLEHLESAEPDITGRVAALVAESGSRVAQQPDYSLERPFDSTYLDPEWRFQAKGVFSKFTERLEEREYPPAFVFNALQTATQLDFPELSLKMARAVSGTGDPVLRAKVLSTLASYGERNEAIKSFEELLASLPSMVEAREDHLVLAQAWNAAENLRRHASLAAKMNAVITSDPNINSYWYLLAAEATMRASEDQWAEESRDLYERGLAKLREESPTAPWYRSSLQEVASLAADLSNYDDAQAFLQDMSQ